MMHTAPICYPVEVETDRLPYEATDRCAGERWQRWNENLVKEFSDFLKGVVKGAAALGMGIAAVFLALILL